MKKTINSAQLGVRLIHLIVDGDTLAFSGEDKLLVESVSTTLDEVTVKLNGFARPKGGRNISVAGMFTVGTSDQAYKFLSSNTEEIVFETLNTGVHGSFGVTLLVNDSKNIYSK